MTPDTYKTKDLGEAAALYSFGVILSRLEKDNNFFWFVFIDKELCEFTSNEYWAGTLTLSAKSLIDSLKTLKDRIFSQKYEES